MSVSTLLEHLQAGSFSDALQDLHNLPLCLSLVFHSQGRDVLRYFALQSLPLRHLLSNKMSISLAAPLLGWFYAPSPATRDFYGDPRLIPCCHDSAVSLIHVGADILIRSSVNQEVRPSVK